MMQDKSKDVSGCVVELFELIGLVVAIAWPIFILFR